VNKIIEFVSILAFIVIATVLGHMLLNTGALSSIENIVNVFSGLGWFIGTFIVATLFTAYLVVIADTKFLVRFLAIPSWLVFTISLLITVDSFLGYPYPSIPPQSQVVAYRVVTHGENHNNRTIEAWMYFWRDNRTRAYSFPYSLEAEKKLLEGQQATANGVAMEVNLSGDKQTKSGGDKGDEGDDYLIEHEGMPRKPDDYNDVYPESTATDGPTVKSTDIVIDIPGIGSVELPAGTSFKVLPSGEVEILEPEIISDPSEMGHGRGGSHPPPGGF